MLSKKSIVLTGKANSKQKAVLSMECDGQMLSGRVRLYNFSSEPCGIISLGLYDDGKVTKAGLTKTSSMLFSFATGLDKIPAKFSCALVNFVDGEPTPLLYGTSEGQSDQEEIFASVINSIKGTNSMKEVEEVLDEYGIDYDDEEKAEIDNTIEEEFAKLEKEDLAKDNDFECDKCKNCKYKKFYLSHSASIKSLSDNEELEIKENEFEENVSFYSQIKDQVEKLFAENKTEDYLQELIPNSKWVKVELDDGNDYYVFGLIYENDKLKYVCYGVPGVFQKNPPRELSGYPVWFPLDSDRRDGFGYWLTYQDASTGESIKAIVE